MVFMIIIPFLNGYFMLFHWEYTQHFQTNPYVSPSLVFRRVPAHQLRILRRAHRRQVPAEADEPRRARGSLTYAVVYHAPLSLDS